MTLIHLVIPDRKTTTRPRLRANTNDRDEVRVADGLRASPFPPSTTTTDSPRGPLDGSVYVTGTTMKRGRIVREGTNAQKRGEISRRT